MEAKNVNTYIQPEIKVIKYEVEDFIATSIEHDNAFADIGDFFKKVNN